MQVMVYTHINMIDDTVTCDIQFQGSYHYNLSSDPMSQQAKINAQT